MDCSGCNSRNFKPKIALYPWCNNSIVRFMFHSLTRPGLWFSDVIRHFHVFSLRVIYRVVLPFSRWTRLYIIFLLSSAAELYNFTYDDVSFDRCGPPVIFYIQQQWQTDREHFVASLHGVQRNTPRVTIVVIQLYIHTVDLLTLSCNWTYYRRLFRSALQNNS